MTPLHTRDGSRRCCRAAASRPDVGMCASQVRLQDTDRLDSTGMLIAGDASSKQRGHGRTSSDYAQSGEALFPSGSAALFRRAMLNQIGGFDADFFLYCEDTDLGLRARYGRDGSACMWPMPSLSIGIRIRPAAHRL